MKRFIGIIAVVGALAFALAGCSGSAEQTYDDIYKEYSEKMEQQAPELVHEYLDESASLGADIQAKATLSNDKIAELADTNAEGMEKMAQLMQKKGDDYSKYEEWAGKLNDVYMEQAQTITDAYMNSAMQM